jgi:putative ABC transport system permease protein
MTTLAHRPALSGPANGGVAARRALVRWAWRMLRREGRQQLLVVTLLTVAVAAAIGSITIAYNAVPADNSDFGSANQVLTFDASDPQALQAGLGLAERWFGTVDVIGHRSVSVPGSVEKVDYRSDAPGGTYTDDLLALRRGSYPTGAGEVAVTDGVAESLRLEIGSTLALDGRRRTVVGIVENPSRLSDEFALVAPASASPELVHVFVDALLESRSSDSFYNALGDRNHARWGFAGSKAQGNDVSSTTETLAMFSVATVFLLLASLVAAAGFAVVAQRRLRRLGMLAAVGATEKHLRLVLVANGAVVGTVAALVGTIAGLALWLVFAPTLESAVDHRIDRLSLPWGLVALAVVLAVVGATAAAWWPGRTVARIPVLLALSGRPPEPRPTRHSALVAAALIAVGMGCLALSGRDRPLLIIAGLVATILGALFLGPLAIRLFTRAAAGRSPIAVRLALRDLARYQARSGAALAAITLALGIAATVVVIGAAEEKKSAGAPPNLSDTQIRVYTDATPEPTLVPIQTPAEVERMAAAVRRLAADLGDATVIPLHNAIQPGAEPGVVDGIRVVDAEVLSRKVASAERDGGGGSYFCPGPPPASCYRSESRLYVATPALLRYLGIDPATVDPSTDFLVDSTVRTDGLVTVGLERTSKSSLREPKVTERAVTNVQRIDSRKLFGSPSGDAVVTPTSFITLDGLRRRGLRQIASGWLVESSRPLTSEQIADARELAAAGGLTIETRHESASYTTLIAIATAAGALLALATLAMTVGLIRGESAGDLRTLTATGATSRVRRTLTAATAGALALLGALLGVGGAYLALGATYYDKLDYLGRFPVLYLALMVVGIPLTAAAAGWLLAGREPTAVARPAIE